MAITFHHYRYQTVVDRADGQADATNTTLYGGEKRKELVRSVRPCSCFQKFASNAAANIFRIDRWCHHRPQFQAVPHRQPPRLRRHVLRRIPQKPETIRDHSCFSLRSSRLQSPRHHRGKHQRYRVPRLRRRVRRSTRGPPLHWFVLSPMAPRRIQRSWPPIFRLPNPRSRSIPRRRRRHPHSPARRRSRRQTPITDPARHHTSYGRRCR